MTTSQKLTIRLSEIREKLNELLGIDARTDDQNTEMAALTTEAQKLEPELRAAIVVEGSEAAAADADAPDAETRERQRVTAKARVGDFIKAFLDNAVLDGASAECRSAFGLTGYEIPLPLFEPRGGRPREVRAATPSPTATPVEESPVQPYVYARGHAAFLGIDLVSVGPGAHSFPALTTPTPSGPKAAGDNADETAAAFTAASQKAKRVTGSFRVRMEDLATFPQMEDALRRDAPLSLADRVDKQVVAGNNTAPNLNGLSAQLTAVDDEDTVDTFALMAQKAAALIDGRYAAVLTEIRQLLGLATYTHAAGSLYTAGDAISVVAYLDSVTGGVRSAPTEWIAAAASNVQGGIARLGMRPMCAASALWGGVQLIRDPYTSAAAGEIIVTGVQLLSDVVVVHPGAYKATSFKLA